MAPEKKEKDLVEKMKKDLNYWRQNAEEDYLGTPISVLRYISEVEKVVTEITTVVDVKYLTILNFESGTVHQYEIDNSVNNFEEFIVDEGFSLDNVQWMVHDTSGVIYEK